MSKFDKIFEARETEAAEAKENGNNDPISKKSPVKKKSNAVKQKSPDEIETIEQLSSQTNAKRGRPTAKRSDPDFVGFTTYVRRDTHTRAKIALLQEGKGKELSELVEDLIHNWLKQK